MKKSEAATILAKISAYDRRTVGEADIEAWSEALDGQVTVQDALVAVRDHFRESSDWLMPNMIIKRCRSIRAFRINIAGAPDYPAGLTYEQERKWLKEWHRALAMGAGGRHPTLPSTAQASADYALGITRVESTYLPPDEAKARLAALLADSKGITA